MSERLSRLIDLLTRLQSQPLVTATVLADEYGVSVRTVYRDIRTLEAAGVPIIVEDGKGYRLNNYHLRPPKLSTAEVNALVTAERLVKQNKDASLIAHHNSAMQKLKATFSPDNKSAADHLASRIAIIQNLNNDTPSEYLNLVESALLEHVLLSVVYHAISTDTLTERYLEPLALYYSRENWVLIAWCRLRDDYREFRLDRFKSLSKTDKPFTPQPFDLMTYFQRYN